MAGIDENTKLYIRFNEGGEGATNSDDQTERHTETFNGTAQLTLAQTKYAEDISSLLLDGNSDSVSVPDSADWDFHGSTEDFKTIDLWVYLTSATAGIFEHYEDGNNCYYLWCDGVNGWRYSYRTGGSEVINTSTRKAAAQNQWIHVCAVVVNGVFGLYLNGTQVAYDNAWPADTFSGNFVTGKSSRQSAYLSGYVAHLRVQHSNYFNAAPDAGLTNTITVPTEEYTSGTGDGAASLSNIVKLSRIKKELQLASIMGGS